MFTCLLLIISLVISQLMPSLLPWFALQVLLLLAAMVMPIAFITKNNYLKSLALVLAAFSYGQIYGHISVDNLWQKTDPRELQLIFHVDSLVESKSHYQKFQASVASDSSYLARQKILLSAYQPLNVKPCYQYTAIVRLKPIHGLQNPAGFDYYSYLFEQGIKAKGYIKTIIEEKPTTDFCIHGLRQSIKSRIDDKFKDLSPWVLALSIGDKTAFNDKHWQLLKETATGHLFVVSGLHIGLIAFAVFYAVLAVRRLGFALWLLGDWRPMAYLLGFSAAFAYALLAGFTLPTQRALIMLLVFFFGQFLGVRIDVWLRFIWALLLLLIIQPNAFLNGGFVLSFTALFFVLSLGRQWPKAKSWQSKLALLMLWQLLLSILLLPLLYGYFDYWPWLSPLYNFVAIPWVTLIVLPALLLGLVLWLIFDAALLLTIASFALQIFVTALEQSHSLLGFTFGFTLTPWQLLALSALLSTVVIASYRRFLPLALVFLFAVLLIPWLFVKPKPLATLQVIDVGQGLSVLLQSQQQSMLVDLGSSWSSGSMVKFAVLPQLKAQAITNLDHLVISHHDNDHLGDYRYLLSQLPVGQIHSNRLLKSVKPSRQHLCRQGQQFSVGAIDVTVLGPKAPIVENENDSSCVLLLNVLDTFILLPGDISAAKEQELLSSLPKKMQVLVLAHHGSRYSSSEGLLQRFKQGVAIASAGFLNPFKHPHPDVQKRLQRQQIQLFNTAEHGLVQLQINHDGAMHWQSFAGQRGFGYW